MLAGFGAIDLVDTHVAMALGASVHPFTITTASVSTVVIKNAGLVNN
jgi:hypothetical protein